MLFTPFFFSALPLLAAVSSAFPNAGKAVKETRQFKCSLSVKTLSTDTCDIVVVRFGITKANFVAWNPSVGSGCTGFVGGTSYCIRGSGTGSPVTSAPTSSATVSPSSTSSSVAPVSTLSKDGSCGGTAGLSCKGTSFVQMDFVAQLQGIVKLVVSNSLAPAQPTLGTSQSMDHAEHRIKKRVQEVLSAETTAARLPHTVRLDANPALAPVMQVRVPYQQMAVVVETERKLALEAHLGQDTAVPRQTIVKLVVSLPLENARQILSQLMDSVVPTAKLVLEVLLAVCFLPISTFQSLDFRLTLSPTACCSAGGWCGSTAGHCAVDAKCQANFGICTSTNLSSDDCCSASGYCGTGVNFCAQGCQKGSSSACTTTNIPSLTGECGKNNLVCAGGPFAGTCCSTSGFCGKGTGFPC
ncbi:uncharacterized protein RCO7_01241 [Rhynchosporium graminicola]|uniref:Chitin-binding type-1 domain-containing protein n=1 Tax=Rhynchosporium graminicola TaxID=2792576 RepID=A0A1E1LTQ0_9HELO|nr:uncharacterized protein RCO7_01241 [Rhynchosporium commune]